MCSSIITICVLHKEDSPEEQKSAGCSSSPPATPRVEGRRREQRRWKRRSRDVKETDGGWGGGKGLGQRRCDDDDGEDKSLVTQLQHGERIGQYYNGVTYTGTLGPPTV